MKKHNFGWSLAAIVGLMLLGLTSCEQEDRFVGSNVVGDGAAQFHKAYLDLVATTIATDTLRADRSVLQNASIGVYDEPLLGKTKSYLYSQVRLGTTNPEFGNNAVVDSVVLSIPVFTQTKDTLSKEYFHFNTNYTISNSEDGDCNVTDTIRQYKTRYLFNIDSIYGNKSATMSLQVHRIMEGLKTIDSARYSNQSVQIGELFGSKQINSKAYKTFTSQFRNVGTETDSTIIAQDASAVINMKLDGMKTFVQNNIVDQVGSPNLGDQVSFINNVIQGIRIGVQDENGFILTINPSFLKLVAYISVDNENFVDENNNGIHDPEENCGAVMTKARVNKNLDFVIGSNLAMNSGNQYYNVVQSRIENSPGSVSYNQPNTAVNFVEGMGGARVKISLDPQQIEAIRDSVRNNNWVISEAHLKVYPHTATQGNLPLPEYLYAFNLSKNKLLADYGDIENVDSDNIQVFPYLQISRPYDEEKKYYLLRVTEYFKNIVEKNAEIDDLAIEMGTYLGFSNADYFYTPKNAFYSNRVFNPYRLAIVGSNPTADLMDKKLQLEIYYNKKEN